ncbi:MAG: aspartate kinase [Marinilabiliales bacterium]|nr:MAG: aspartate kinase [Marinilabiliales bacterium]
MIVMKFGGTSLGNAERIRQVAELIKRRDESFIICSAMSGVTNSLVDISGHWKAGNREVVAEIIAGLKKHFELTCYDLFDNEKATLEATSIVSGHFEMLTGRLGEDYSIHNENWLLSRGEIITSEIFALYLNSCGISVTWLNALDFTVTGSDGEPSVTDMRQRLSAVVGDNPSGRFLTQGYICLDHEGNTSNLRRGGSDYTATLAGAALEAETIEIWTDIDGVRNNDPRFVDDTFPIRELSFDEAAELAYFGAKILHPACVWPASINNIPVQLKNTLEPDAPGTLIRSGPVRKGITAVAAKDGITVIRVRSDRMLNAYGFLSRIFAIFEKHRTPIDVITTSEVSVSVTIDNDTCLPAILPELEKLGKVDTESAKAIVCVVGDVLEQHAGRAGRIIDSLRHFNVSMISYGGSRNNITVVVPAEQVRDILRSLNTFLFGSRSKAGDRWMISQD